jgi:prephenate dehydrogenase
LLTDAGSAKQVIVDALDNQLPRDCRFLGSHPLAGGHRSGAAHADADLFEGRVTIITPTRNTRAEDFDTLEWFWSSLGSMVVQMAPDEHDRALALTSHLPHVAAAVLATMVPENYFRFTGAGLLDTTRIAASDPELWLQIFAANRENVLKAVRQYQSRLSALEDALNRADEAEIRKTLTTAKNNRNALGN